MLDRFNSGKGRPDRQPGKAPRRRTAMGRVTITAIGSGLLFAPGAFIFQVVESWVSTYNSVPRELAIWLIPAFATLVYLLAVGLVYAFRTREAAPPRLEPAVQFERAALTYAESLAEKKRDIALLDLRDAVGLTFHTLNANVNRVRLGTLALEAALRQHQTVRQVSILLDDLGWANHMIGDAEAGLKNIERAIEIVSLLPPDELTPELRLLRAKALRHKAIITATRRSIDEAQQLVATAEQDVLAACPAGSRSRDVELAQLRHAEALFIATSLDLLSGERRIGPDDVEGAKHTREALARVRLAREAFLTRGAFTRYAKALYLEQCLLAALGRELEAREIKTILDDALGKSSWEITVSSVNVRGG